MELEFRNIHIDILAIPMDLVKKPLSPGELQLYQEFADNCAVTRGVVLVTKKATSLRYDVVHGSEVVRAANKALIDYIPCLVCESFTDTFIDLIRARSISPEVNHDVKPEDAVSQAIARYKVVKGAKLSFRKAETIGKLGKKSTIYTDKRLSQNLHPQVKEMVSDSKITKSAARSISYININDQLEFAERAVRNNWTVRDIDLEKSKCCDTPIDESMKSDIDSFRQQLEELWGGVVSITPKTRQTGTVCFEFYNLDEIATLCGRIAKVASELVFVVKGKHRPNFNGKTGTFEIKYSDLDALEKLKKSLEQSPITSLTG